MKPTRLSKATHPTLLLAARYLRLNSKTFKSQQYPADVFGKTLSDRAYYNQVELTLCRILIEEEGNMEKTYANRDSATALLKKAGVKVEDYDRYITKVTTGFRVTLPDSFQPKVAKAAEPGVKPKERKPTIQGVAVTLIKAGKDNAAVWETIKKQFGLTDSKKHYPQLIRRLLTQGKIKS